MQLTSRGMTPEMAAKGSAQVKKAEADKLAKRVAALNTVAGEHVKKMTELLERLEKAAAEYKKNADKAKATEVKTVRKELVATKGAAAKTSVEDTTADPRQFRPLYVPVSASADCAMSHTVFPFVKLSTD